MKTDPETEFFSGLIELQYGHKVQGKLRMLGKKIPWAHGWPLNKRAFWNAEAFMWEHKVEKNIRELIAAELASLSGKNLDLGCGSYSYLPSVGFDVAERMLRLNESCRQKVIGDIEKKLPFAIGSFDSVTAVFILNYVNHHQQLFREISRILKPQGQLVMVLWSKGVQPWQRQHEQHRFLPARWTKELQKAGFMVRFYEKEGLWFWWCRR